MHSEIHILNSRYMMIDVNCYLIQTISGFILVDTGLDRKYTELLRDLERCGCEPGNLKLVLLTHGDFDHTGNSAAIREQYHAPIALHSGDVENVSTGDMFANKKISPFTRWVMNIMLGLIGMSRFRTFTPDVLLEDGQDLSTYGWQARVIHLPGHSKGSVGFLSAEGDLFCGDEFENTSKPVVNELADDPILIQASAQKLSQLGVNTVYPGHGKPFLFNELAIK